MADIYSLTIRADTRDVTRAKQALDGLSSGAVKAQKTTDRVTASTKNLAPVTRNAGQGLRGMSMQLSQVAQQASASGNWLQALAIQLPDLALAFGPVGIAVGAVAGGLLSYISASEDAEEETKTFIERIEGLELAYSDLNAEVRTALELERARKAEQFRQQIEEQEKALRDAVTTQQAYNNVMKAGSAEAARFGGGITPEKLAASQEAAKEARGEMGLLKLELEALNDRYDDYLDGSAAAAAADEERREKLDRLVETIKAQGETVGMTARETALYEAARLGANEADLAAIRNSFDLIEAGRRQQEAQKALMDATKISVKDDPILQRIEAQRRAQELLAEESAMWAEKIAANQQNIQQQSVATVGASIGAMQSFFEAGSAEFIAFGLMQKALMAGQAVMAANLAATLALTAQVPGDPTGPARAIAQAETIRTLGYINAGLILATGIGEAVAGSRQMGGSVSAGGRYLVGENGPEVVTMGGSGVVTPSSVMDGESKEGDVIVNVNNAPPGTRTESRRDDSGNRFIDVFISDIATGGPMSKSIQSTYGVRRQGR